MIPNSIISLENVRRVNRKVNQTKHTSYGKPYTLTHYSIEIVYCDGGSEFIEFGHEITSRDLCDTTFQIILEKLGED